ncbi:MAG: molybdopterin-dependent oxidoreductase [Gordonibacter urolithinfaciens]
MEKWTYGFDEYAERCCTMTPERAAEICEVPVEDIYAAARCLAQKPCTASVGLKTDQNPNTLQICHAIWGIFAICGNLDNPGGIKLGQTMLNGGSTGRKGVGMLVEEEDTNPIPIAGHDQYPAMDFIINTTQPDCTLDTLRTNIPYPIEFLFIQSSNFISSCITQQPMQWMEACRHKEFVVATDIFMNPTIQALADVVLPVSTSLEHEGIVTFHGCNQPGQFHALTKVLEPLGECKSDLEIMLDLDHRINPDRTEDAEKWSSPHAYLDNKIQNIPYTADPDTGEDMTYETLREWVYGRYEIPYYQYELGLLRADGKPGFKSPTGRVELWSTVKQHLGEDPLPYYEEPRFSKRSRPEWIDEYPLDFVTGARRPTSFHTEHRMIDSLREIRTAATVEIHPATAEKHGIGQGDWVTIENPWGKCQMVADITPIVKEGVIGCDHGWWYPEDKDAELFSVRKSSINSLMPWKEIGKLGLGSHYGALPCKIYRTEN